MNHYCCGTKDGLNHTIMDCRKWKQIRDKHKARLGNGLQEVKKIVEQEIIMENQGVSFKRNFKEERKERGINAKTRKEYIERRKTANLS